MNDEELARARRALSGVDPEIDLARVYAESRARAQGAEAAGDAYEGWVQSEDVEILLRDADSPAGSVRPATRRRTAFVWGAAAAASAAAVALVVAVTDTPVTTISPGSAPGTSTSAPASTAQPDPLPSPSMGLTSGEVVANTLLAVGGKECRMHTRSTLGDDLGRGPTSDDDAGLRSDYVRVEGLHTPKVGLAQQPFKVLQAVSVDAVLGLFSENRADSHLRELSLEDLEGETVVRIEIVPADMEVVGGTVTRIELLVDLTTWLPRAEEIWAEADGGEQYLMRSEFSWSGCGTVDISPSRETG